ncbi:DUF418 domain-containing protein [Pseudonocardiaceae bacterium YIM PH 21723]|nr:DUF418 domain-containing protein [Pseudonocardiaceae bacterium YIM PH 21723]
MYGTSVLTSEGDIVSTALEQPSPQLKGRIQLLDVLRGVAILGTLGTNIWIFTNPGGIVAYIQEYGHKSGVQQFFTEVTNGKFLGMLTILFGVGLAIQHASAQRRGQHWPGRYLWRATLLLLDGLLHYVLVIEFDVLMGYAVTAMIAAFILIRSDRAIRLWMWITGSVHVLLIGLATVATSSGPTGAPDTGAVTLYTDGSWAEQVLFRLQYAPLWRAEAVFIIPMSICLYLLGVRLYRAGAFGPGEQGMAIRRKLLAFGGAVGVPLTVIAAIFQLSLLDRYVFGPIVSLFYIGLIGVFLDRRGKLGPLTTRLATIGRMALSNYVLQNLLASILCYGWGFGLATVIAGTSPWLTVLLWLVISLMLLGFSSLWQRRFPQGPLELAWKYLYELPFRRS